MRHIRLPAPILRAASPVVQLWWKIRKPKTYGVKVLLRHPDGKRFLVVRHSYADTKRWGLPGGGYNPNCETPEKAAARELYEELAIKVNPNRLVVLRTLETNLEAKRDTLTLLTVAAPIAEIEMAPELEETRWVTEVTELGNAPVSRWLVAALAQTKLPLQNNKPNTVSRWETMICNRSSVFETSTNRSGRDSA